MKKYIVLMIAFSLIVGVSCQEKIDMVKETDAIKKVIEDEIKASFNGDYETWTTFFVHEPFLLWLQATKTGYSYFKGWDDLNSEAKKFITSDRAGNWVHAGNDDYSIRIYKGAALATFRLKLTQTGDNKEIESVEVRSLEKQNGDWKIVYLGTVRLTTYDETVPDETEMPPSEDIE